MKNHIITVSAAILSLYPTISSAQDLHEHVSVEGTYRPDIIKGERFNTFPEHVKFNLDPKALPADSRGVVAAFASEARALDIRGWHVDSPNQPRGYVDVSLGSWLNSSLSAGFTPLKTRSSQLDVSLQHNSTSLWRPKSEEYTDADRRYRYDESLAVRYHHSFSGMGYLDAQLQYHLGLFNYYSYLPVAPSQTLNDIAARVGFLSDRSSSSAWHAALHARYFGMRRMYVNDDIGLESFKGGRETVVGADGGWSMQWDNGSRIGADANLDIIMYASDKDKRDIFGLPEAPSGYGMLGLKPYYRFTRENFIIQAGVALDFAFNAPGEDTDSHFSAIHISPDVRIDWQSGRTGLYLHLLGGCKPTTLASLYSKNYYTMPVLGTARPVYTPLDGRLGINFGSFSGFRAGLELGFRASKYVPYVGWYPAYLSEPLNIYKYAPNRYAAILETAVVGRDIHGWRLALSLGYNSRYFDIDFRGAYMPQNRTFGWTDGLGRSRWDLSTKLKVRPIKPLSIAVSFQYQGVRSLDVPIKRTYMDGGRQLRGQSVIINGEKQEYASVRLSNLPRLGLEAEWKLSERIAVGIQGFNLLNRKLELLPDLPTPGIDFQGRLTIKF
ncbi:MAG: hypothetical protein NC097_07465 [Clostridium sp.]|nr:hypothetical protein [Prevotella sp.]MCM1429615.1 hypothetical protein [Clostridium sp.]MCM1476094.1 hypothetical protein [Muribaculaceae bacterium]